MSAIMTRGSSALEERIAAVRRFTRFYSRHLGLLQEELLTSGFSLTEGRVLYELAHRDPTTATALAADLNLDAGYLSRILRRFGEAKLISKKSAAGDARQSLIAITAKGRKAFAPLNESSRTQVAAMLESLSFDEQARLTAAMTTVEGLLQPAADARPPVLLLRPHRPGDMGWVTSVNAALYAQEYGWDISYESLVAKITAEFIDNFHPRKESCWIAEMDGQRVGSVFVVRKNDTIAKLRLLIVDPKARGLGLGGRFVDECLRFAKSVGYKRMTLWTQSSLVAARRIYAKAGFECVAKEPHHSFGVDLIGETWERDL
jgi:DNA-binding MarR family transcriptional regulator/GNAT superfamily N-acetyltransferase